MRRYLASEKLDPYEFKILVFDNGEPEELLLFIWYFNMTNEASGMIGDGAKIKYLRTVVRG